MKCGNCGRECTPGQASICSECGLVLCPGLPNRIRRALSALLQPARQAELIAVIKAGCGGLCQSRRIPSISFLSKSFFSSNLTCGNLPPASSP